ncbi:MAG: DUF2079 domain-containing protein [Candidatus Aureabacteria bacterium]|nr:DUF2079 domain-containing protein [Candidatus Auribacterota bacterium]
MNSRRRAAYLAALCAALGGAGLGAYIACIVGERWPNPVLLPCIVILSAVIAMLILLREQKRGHGDLLALVMPYTALLIPAAFIPDYAFGHGPGLVISLAMLVVAFAGYGALKFMLLSPAAPVCKMKLARAGGVIMAIATVAWITYHIVQGIIKYYNFGYAGLDMGIFMQSFWTATRGELFRNTHEIYPVGSRFGKHFAPFMFLILPAYAIVPHAGTLIVVNSLFLGLIGPAVHRLARRGLGGYGALCFGLAALMYPALSYQARDPYYDMHYAPLLLLLALIAYRAKRLGLFCLCILFSCGVREDIALTVAIFGVIALIQRMPWRWVLLPFLIGFGWFMLASCVIVPAFGPGTISIFYKGMGHSPLEMLRTLIADPVGYMQGFSSLGYFKLLYLMVIPLGFIFPFLGIEIVGALPALVVIGLSSAENTRSIYGYYYLPCVPFLFAGAISGVGALSRRLTARHGTRELSAAACTLIFFFALAVWVRGPLAETIASDMTRPYNAVSGPGYNEVLREVIGLIPPDAPVFVPRTIKPHLAHRMFVSAVIPYDAEYLVVDSYSEDPFVIGVQRDPFIQGLERNPRYMKLFDRHGVRLYRRR